MRRVVAVLVVLTAVLAAATTVHSQPVRNQSGTQATEQAREQAQAAEKAALARQILQAREDLQRRGPLDPAFWSYWTERLTSLSLSQLQGIVALGTDAGLEGQIALVTGSVLADNALPDLGDSSKDLVYTKVAPCRVADTRVAGGALGTGALRNFYIAGVTGFPGQGGTPCGVPFGPATAVAMNVTVVGATGYGWLRAYPYGGSGNASIINYNAGDTIANGLVMPICDPASATCTYDLTVVADSYGGHVLIDVMGYWAKVNKAQYRSFTALTVDDTQTEIPLTPSPCVSYLSQTVVAPVAGRITVTANAQFRIHHTYGTPDGIFAGIVTTATNCTYTWGWLFLINPSTLPTDDYHPFSTVSKTFDVTAGSYTFYLNAFRNNNPSGSHFFNVELLTRFEPM